MKLDLPALLTVGICEAQKQLDEYLRRLEADALAEGKTKRARTRGAATTVNYSLVLRYMMLRCRSFNNAVRRNGESVFERAASELVDTGLIWKIKKPQYKFRLTKRGHEYAADVLKAITAAEALFNANTTKEQLLSHTVEELEQFAIVKGIKKDKKSALVRNVLEFLRSGKVDRPRKSLALARVDYGLMRWITNDDRAPDDDDGKPIWDDDPAVPVATRPLVWDGPMYNDEENSDTDTFTVLGNLLGEEDEDDDE
jgi:hypothetical protein